MRHWTPEERQAQSALIHAVKPWLLSTGPRTAEGKERSRMNARKHGLYSREFTLYKRLMREMNRSCKKILYLQRLERKPRISEKEFQRIVEIYESDWWGKGG